MRLTHVQSLLCSVAVAVLVTAAPAIDLKGKLKKSVESVEKKIPGTAPADSANAQAETAAPAAASPGEPASIAQVSSKYDYVPGDKVLFFEDFTKDELGEFPVRMRLLEGNFDVVDFEGQRWVRLNGNEGVLAAKVGTPLPEKWTLDFDYSMETVTSPSLMVYAADEDGHGDWWLAQIGTNGGPEIGFSSGSIWSNASLPGRPGLDGRHHVSIMANGKSIKIYIDRERLVNVPEMAWPAPPSALYFRIISYDQQRLISNVRIAEGGKPKPDLLADGPFVTHGIYFDTGSDRLRAESAPVLRLVANYMKEHSDTKVHITGHTDNVGDDAANQTLSEKRATAVVQCLVSDFAIPAERLTAAGKGESVPLASNDTTEGRATNRRVEFSKI